MNIKFLIPALALCLCAYTVADAATKKKVYLKLIEAYSKKNTSAEMPTETGTHFVIRWEVDKYPETFFWRGQSGWLGCNVQKAHKIKSKSKTATYRLEDVSMDQVHKGDTLMISPYTGGRFPIPNDIPASAKNVLYFQSGGNMWLSFPVKKITKR